MAIKGNFKMGGIDYSTPSLNNNINYAPSFVSAPPVIDPVEFVPSLPSVTNEMPSNRQPGLNISNDMIQEDMMKEVVKIQLQDLQQNKDILQNIDAGDGSGRNLYQTEIQDIITKSPLHQEAYLEEYPIGGTINTVVPDIMETVAKTAVPGLGVASEILDSFNIDPKINNDTFSIDQYGFDSLGQQLDKYGILDDFTFNNGINDYSYDGLQDSTIFDNTNNDPLKDMLEKEIINKIPGGGKYGNNAANTDTVTISPYSTGLNYAMSIADGQNVPGMIAPSMSYSAANPEGFTQADINDGLVPNPFVPPAPQGTPSPYGVFADDPSYFGTGIGGVNIPVDRKQDLPPKDFILGNNSVEQPKGYQPLSLAGIQRVLDNLS